MRDVARAAGGRTMDHAVSSVPPMSSLADQPAADGDRDSTIAAHVEQLYESHAGLVRSVCRSLLRDRVEAEDAVQQTFLSAQRALLNGSEPRDAGAWLATIARHESLARVRGRMREPLPMEVEEHQAAPDAHAAAVGRHDAGALRDALAELPAQQREAILLREVRGFSYQEVAASLSVTTSAVESLLFRARRRLQTRLQGSLAALSLGEWVQPLRDLAARLVGGGIAAPAAAKVAVVGLGTAVVAGGAVVGPTELGRGHAPHTVTHVVRPPVHRVFQTAAPKPPMTFSAPASHPDRVDSASRREVSDVRRTAGTGERERPSETTSRTSGEDRSSPSGSSPETSDTGGATQSTLGASDGSQTSTTEGSQTATSDTTSSDSSSGTATTSPATPDD
jgi:RNA polymerase sigma-70 factor (ECF subfamily)